MRGWGTVCQGVKTGGLWSQMEQKLHINCLELLGGSFAVKSFTKDRLCVHVRLRMDNTSAVAYVNRLGGTHSLVLANLALALWEWALNRNIFLSAEHLSGRLNATADWQSRHFDDSSNWQLCPEVFRALMQIRGPCANDLFADRLNTQLPPVLQLEARPNGNSLGCPSTGLVEGKKLCISPILSHNAITSKIEGTRCRADISGPIVAHTSLVPQLIGPVSVPTGSSANDPESLAGPPGGDTPSTCESDSSASRLACIQRSLHSEGIRAGASKLVLAAWRPGTNAVYNSAWKKWHSWCLGRETDPFRPSLADLTGFLAHSFDEGLEYRTINTYRSALPGVLPPIDGFPVGQHPLVIRLLKGVLKPTSSFAALSADLERGRCLDLFALTPSERGFIVEIAYAKVGYFACLNRPSALF